MYTIYHFVLSCSRFVSLERKKCQGSCQHTSCSSCVLLKAPSCPQTCISSNSSCLLHFGKCVHNHLLASHNHPVCQQNIQVRTLEVHPGLARPVAPHHSLSYSRPFTVCFILFQIKAKIPKINHENAFSLYIHKKKFLNTVYFLLYRAALKGTWCVWSQTAQMHQSEFLSNELM